MFSILNIIPDAKYKEGEQNVRVVGRLIKENPFIYYQNDPNNNGVLLVVDQEEFLDNDKPQ